MEQKEVWDELAEQWYHFRQRPFRDISKEIGEMIKLRKGTILDIGCGNCRNLSEFAKNRFECYGIDFSKEMLKYAKQFCDKNKIKVNLKYGLAEKIPFKNNFFDYCLSIAVLHHLETKEKRQRGLKEIYRILKRDGIALISVWNKLPLNLFIKNKYFKWRKAGKAYYRHYYYFTYWELKRAIKKTGFKILKDSGVFGKNIWFLAKK